MNKKSSFLPYGRQTIDAADVDAVASAVCDEYLTTGPKVAEFESAFARATGAVHAVACNSGTAALHLAALALDLGPGQSAIVPSITFLSTANVVRMTGADVVFADVDPDTGLMTSRTFADALARAAASGRKVVAAFPVHLGGQVCEMADLARIAAAEGVALVEDACHSLGIEGIGAADRSRLACFSTHPVKAIATGEGGVVTTRDAGLAERMRRLRSHGMCRDSGEFENRDLAFEQGEPNPWYYEMAEIGWNYRLPDILCALGVSQLGKLERFHRRRAEIASLYDELLGPLAPMIRPALRTGQPHGWHLYAVLVDFTALGMSRAEVMKDLRAQGIGTQVHYIPVHLQPYYRRRYGETHLPGADRYYARCLSVPIYPDLTDDDVHRVAAALSRLADTRGHR
jgi:UDP-4-amino-4,6-dideoxy-N-acetyl-beta-L-altrosamine transaminase